VRNSRFAGKRHSVESKQRISESNKGRPPTFGMLGKRHSKASKRRMSKIYWARKKASETPCEPMLTNLPQNIFSPKEIRARGLKERKDKIRQKILDTTTKPTPLANLAKRYPVILLDPPWKFEGFENRSGNRGPENHYDTMTIDEIAQLPISDITTDTAVMFCWSTNTHVAKCIKLMEAWGFEYLTNIC
jgi:hypothetical protein